MTFLEENQIHEFNRNGFIVLDFGFEADDIDGVVSDLNIRYDKNRSGESGYAPNTRIQDAWHFSERVRQIATKPEILMALEQLYNRKPLPFQTLNFPIGTQQRPHSDSVHFSSIPSGFMAGVWVALEDIDETNGALQYFAGSHKLPYFDMYDVGVKEGYKNYKHYEDFLENKIKEQNLKRELGVLKKGQALIWHANLFHGGSEHKDKSKSRHSQVTHYYFEGCQYYTPMLSSQKQLFFRNPEWIPQTPLTGFEKSRLGLKVRKYNNIRRQPNLFHHLCKRLLGGA